MVRRQLLLCFFILTVFTCSVPKDKELPLEVSTIYGKTDDRLDIYQLNQSLSSLKNAFSSVGMLIDVKHLQPADDSNLVNIVSETFQEEYKLCDNDQVYYRGKLFSQKFLDQPSPGYCSGFFIGKGLFITAGHCLNGQNTDPNPADVMRKINNTRVVFDYQLGPNGEIPTSIPKENIFRISEKAKEHTWGGLDYAVLELAPAYSGFDSLGDRPALEFKNDPVNSNPIALVGFPSGLPMKFAQGEITRASDQRFYVNADGFPGNSGAPIFDLLTEQVVGVYVSSVDINFDYPGQQPDGSIPDCQVLYYCEGSIGNCYGKEAMKSNELIDVIDNL